MEVLDNENVIAQRDPFGALDVAASEWRQLLDPVDLRQFAAGGTIANIVLAGMGGSALAAAVAKDWLDLHVPFEIVRTYRLPKYVDDSTLVIVSSFSGNTEEAITAFHQATAIGTQVAVIASGGQLIELAKDAKVPYVQVRGGIQPRMALGSGLRALVVLLEAYGIIHDVVPQLEAVGQRLETAVQAWVPSVPEKTNRAKQLALHLVGKTPVIYASSLMRSIAYKWKISFNENAKNVAFCNELPEFNHNEFLGWTSHPVQKPFGVIDLVSSFDDPHIKRRFKVSAKLLSGKRPHPITIELQGESMLEQMLWGALLADFVSIYLALLNGVEPTKVDLIERLKDELKEDELTA